MPIAMGYTACSVTGVIVTISQQLLLCQEVFGSWLKILPSVLALQETEHCPKNPFKHVHKGLFFIRHSYILIDISSLSYFKKLTVCVYKIQNMEKLEKYYLI